MHYKPKVANVMGNGPSTFGYGQSLESSAAASTTFDPEHMADIHTDMINARVHQVGSVPNSVATVGPGNVIEEDSADTESR